MNTTEVYVEPVFVGFLVLLAVALPWFPELAGFLMPPSDTPSTEANLDDNLAIKVFFGGLMIGCAYLIGVIVDRFIDSALAPIEKHNRLQFALKQIVNSTPPYDWASDPYPEDELRAKVLLGNAESANGWIDGLRTRIRLKRAMAFTTPAITHALAILLDRSCSWTDFKCRAAIDPLAVYSILIIALIPFLLSGLCPILGEVRQPQCRQLIKAKLKEWREADASSKMAIAKSICETCNRSFGVLLPPRTNDSLSLRIYAEIRGWFKPLRESKPHTHSLLNTLIDAGASAFTAYAAILLLRSWCIGLKSTQSALILSSTALGVALTLLAFWAWWRSTKTFMHYLVTLNPRPFTPPRQAPG